MVYLMDRIHTTYLICASIYGRTVNLKIHLLFFEQGYFVTIPWRFLEFEKHLHNGHSEGIVS